MRALTYRSYGPLENLIVDEVDPVEPRDGQIAVTVRRAALNPKDAVFRKGRFRPLSGRRFPKRCGLDFAGVVRASRSPRFAVGDRVFGALDEWTMARGTLADEVCVADRECAPIPGGVSDDDAAAVALVGQTSLQALRDIGRVAAGARVWIHGASGGVGAVAIQLARGLGAEVTTTSSAANLAFCRELGAHHALDYAADPRVGPVDVVFDVFGNTRWPAVEAALAGGGVAISTVPSIGRLALDLATRWRRVQRRLVVVRPRPPDLDALGRLLAAGELRVPIDSRFPLDRAHDAFRRLESKRTRGKIVIEL